MVRQAKGKKTDQLLVGKGKVTPTMVAYMVDQYLSDNLYIESRAAFRSEASALIYKTPLEEGPKNLMSLGWIIDEYVKLKEESLMVEMEKRRLEQETARVHALLQGFQNVMTAYNASAALSAPPALRAPVCVSDRPGLVAGRLETANSSPAGQVVNESPNTTPPSVAPRVLRQPAEFTTPVAVKPVIRKRQASNMEPGAPINPKKTRSRITKDQSSKAAGSGKKPLCQPSALQSSSRSCAANISPVQGLNVAKILFHKTTSATTTATATVISSGPVTPPRAPSAQSDKNVSPAGGHSSSSNSNNKGTPPDIMSNCTIVSKKTVIVSPFKQEAYYSVEKHCSSTCSPAKDNMTRLSKSAKGRLNFDGTDETTSLEKSTADASSTSESDGNIFDLELPTLDFNISQLLLDFDIHCEEHNLTSQPATNPPNDVSGLNSFSVEALSNGNHTLPEGASTMTEAFTGADSFTAMKMISKSITFSSPAKRQGPKQDNPSA